MPVRIQRKRTKGYRMQDASPNGLPVVYAGRGTVWGNPFRVGHRYALSKFGYMGFVEDPICYSGPPSIKVETAEQAVALFRPYAELRNMFDPEWLAPLRGKNLACWCPLSTHNVENLQSHRTPCHVDFLLSLANK